MKNTPHGCGIPAQADLGIQLRQEAMRIVERAPLAEVRQLLARADKWEQAVIETDRAHRALIDAVIAHMESLPANERKVLEEQLLAEMERISAEPGRAEDDKEQAVRKAVVGTADLRAKYSAAAWKYLEEREKLEAVLVAAKARAKTPDAELPLAGKPEVEAE